MRYQNRFCYDCDFVILSDKFVLFFPYCQASVLGTFIAYLDESNKILEAHMFMKKGFSDWTGRLGFIQRCGDAQRKYKQIHDVEKREL